jgi:colanic acid biosynthesis glycosyl transferase WcaI
MRVLLMTQWFEPEPTFKGLVFARELIKQGINVEVITGFPNYPGGKLYPGYKIKAIQHEEIDGVKVTRLPLYPSHNQSAIGRVINYLSFAVSLLVYGLIKARRTDVIYAYHPPLTVGIAAAIIRYIRGVRVAYDIQDMWPDTLQVTGMISNTKVLNIVGWVCTLVYRNMDHIVVLSPGFKKLLIERGVADHKIDVIYNWCDEASLGNPTSVVPLGFPDDNFFSIVFAGNMGKAQALNAVLDAAKIIQDKTSAIKFVFIGGGVEVDRLKSMAKKELLDNVIFLQPVPMAVIGGILTKADALLVHLRKDPLFTITIPSKTQAYMAVGKPLLMAVDGDAADLVKDAGCGVIAESENSKAIAMAVLKIFNMSELEREKMSERGRNYYRNNLSLQVGVCRFGEIFDRICKEV